MRYATWITCRGLRWPACGVAPFPVVCWSDLSSRSASVYLSVCQPVAYSSGDVCGGVLFCLVFFSLRLMELSSKMRKAGVSGSSARECGAASGDVESRSLGPLYTCPRGKTGAE